MSIQSVKEFLINNNLSLEIIEMDTSTATVELAAAALGVEPARIAKTMALRLKNEDILILAKGDVRIDNKKYKDAFGQKASFIRFEEVEGITGHPVGGVCPFGLLQPLKIFLDESLKVFDYVFPAGGGPNTAIKIDVNYLHSITNAIWIDVCSS